MCRDREPEYPFTEVWVSSAKNLYQDNVRNMFENWGVNMVENFSPLLFRTENVKPTTPLADIAIARAKALSKATGLPAIATVNCADIEAFGSRRNAINARFRIVDNEDSAARFVEQMRLTAKPGNGHRVVNFETCAAYVHPDGECLADYGFCRSQISCANGDMFQVSTDLALQVLASQVTLMRKDWYWEPPAWRTPHTQTEVQGLEPGAQRLQDRLLKDGRILESNIVDVSAFMDGLVDTNLIQDCGVTLANRFAATRPTKLLTVATTGLAVAVPVAQVLQIPMIYARKQRSVVMAESFIATYSSRTVGKARELLIAKDHIQPGDRVLIIDDFLSSGACQDALLRILGEAGAECVGIGVLFEKVYEAGRNYLSGYDLKIESLAKIARVDRGTIELEETDSSGLPTDGADIDFESNPPASLVRGNVARRL